MRCPRLANSEDRPVEQESFGQAYCCDCRLEQYLSQDSPARGTSCLYHILQLALLSVVFHSFPAEAVLWPACLDKDLSLRLRGMPEWAQ